MTPPKYKPRGEAMRASARDSLNAKLADLKSRAYDMIAALDNGRQQLAALNQQIAQTQDTLNKTPKDEKGEEPPK